MKVVIRPESKKDYPAIKEINDLAFGHSNEGILIEKLRRSPGFIPGLSLVAEYGAKLIGHILFYPVKINSPSAVYVSLALAPMSVHPAYQRSGVGKRLVIDGLKRAKEMGYSSVIVLGHSEYYPRFGFKRASAFGIRCPFKVHDNVFLAFELVSGALKDVKGVVEYPKPFNDTI